MESSIAKFLWRQPACERLPTIYKTMSFANSMILVNILYVPTSNCNRQPVATQVGISLANWIRNLRNWWSKLTWLVLGGDPAARSHRVEQLTAL